MATVTCPACQGKYADHFPRCIHCNAPRPGSAPAAPPVAVAVAAPPPPAPAAAPAVAPPRAPASPKPECPCCGGVPGRGTVRTEKREYQGENWSGSKKKYLVRWVDIPGVCGGCMKRLEIRRYIADVLVNVPFVVFFGLLVAFDNKAFLWPLLIYALIVFKWSWGLGYLWADLFLYGTWLDTSLARFEPEGDPGTTRFPAGLWHCLVRLGLLPAMCVALVVAAGLFSSLPKGGSGAVPAAPADVSQIKDPVERAKVYLLSAKDLAVPVDPDTLLMARKNVAREDVYFFLAYLKPSDLPSGSSYQLMTGPELLAAFLRTGGHENDMLGVQGAGGVAVTRWQAATLASSLPAAEPPTTKPLPR